jgi:hypothetical protein
MTDAPHDNLGAAQQLHRRARPEKVVELEPAKTRATSDTQSACSSVMVIVTSGTGAAWVLQYLGHFNTSMRRSSPRP